MSNWKSLNIKILGYTDFDLDSEGSMENTVKAAFKLFSLMYILQYFREDFINKCL